MCSLLARDLYLLGPMCPNPSLRVGSSVAGWDAAEVNPLEVAVATDDSLPPLVSSSSAGDRAGDGSSDDDEDSESEDDTQLRVWMEMARSATLVEDLVADATCLQQHQRDSSTNTPVGPPGRPSSSGSVWWCGAADGEYMDLSRALSWVVPTPRVLAELPRLEEMVATATHPYREQKRVTFTALPENDKHVLQFVASGCHCVCHGLPSFRFFQSKPWKRQGRFVYFHGPDLPTNEQAMWLSYEPSYDYDMTEFSEVD